MGAGEDGPAAGAAEEEAPATADPPPEPEEAAAENVGEEGAGTAEVGRLLLRLGGPGLGWATRPMPRPGRHMLNPRVGAGLADKAAHGRW